MRKSIQEAIERVKSINSRPLLVFLLLAAAFGIVVANGGTARIAENAHMKINGNGWACNEGYREFGDGCMLDLVTRSARADKRARPEQRIMQLETENAHLRREISKLSLKNAVLNAAANDLD